MSEQQTLSQRSAYLDVIKGISIILVTFGHIIQNGGVVNFYPNRCFIKILHSDSSTFFICRFLHWLVGISLLLISETDSKRMYFSSDSYVWHFLGLLDNFFKIYQSNHIHIIRRSHTVERVLSISPICIINYFWLLWAVLLNALILAGIHYFISKKHQLKIAILFGVILMVVPDSMFQNHEFLYVYFAGGFFANQFHFKEIYKKTA